MKQLNKMKVKTITPKSRPSFNDWCREFNVSGMFVKDNLKYNTIQQSNIYKSKINKLYEIQ